MDYIKEIEDIEEEIRILSHKKAKIIEEFISEKHPLKEGEEVIVNGYSHRGKKMIVKTRRIKKSYPNWKWGAEGPIIKANGEVGIAGGKWTQDVDL